MGGCHVTYSNAVGTSNIYGKEHKGQGKFLEHYNRGHFLSPFFFVDGGRETNWRRALPGPRQLERLAETQVQRTLQANGSLSAILPVAKPNPIAVYHQVGCFIRMPTVVSSPFFPYFSIWRLNQEQRTRQTGVLPHVLRIFSLVPHTMALKVV